METPKGSILVVDDEEYIRESLKMGLEEHNYRIEAVADAQSAIEKVRKANGDFDFILMDQVLGPGMDGLEAARNILNEYSGPRIILLTQYGDGNASRRALDIKAYRYVFRPFDVKDIVSLIESSEALRELETALNNEGDKDPFSLRNILENLGFGVSIIDRTYRILYMNPEQRRISAEGCRRGGICWIEYNGVLQQKTPCSWCPVEYVFKTGKPTTKITISFKEDKPHYYEDTASPIFDANSKVIAALELMTDVTEKHELDEATLQAADLDDRLKVVLERIRMLGYTRAMLYVMSEDGNFLHGRAQLGGTKVPITKIILPWKKDPYSVESLKSNTPQIFERGQLDTKLFFEEELERTDVNQWMDIPLRSGDEIVGKISIDNKVIEAPPPGRLKPVPTPITDAHFPELMTIAEYAANAIAAERNFSAVKRESLQLRQLRRMDLRLAESSDVDERLQIIVDSCCQITGADSGHIRIAEGNDLVLKAGRGAYHKYAKKRVPKDDPDSGSAVVAITGRNHIVNNAEEDKHYQDFLKMLSSMNPRPTEAELSELRAICSFASFPIEYEDAVIAVLSIQSKQPDFFTTSVCNVVEELKYRMALEIGVQNPLRQMTSKLAMSGEIQVRIQEVTELQKQLFLILTGVTMKEGLEFNRAMLFLLDESNSVLQGRLAKGTLTALMGEFTQMVDTMGQNVDNFEKAKSLPIKALVPMFIVLGSIIILFALISYFNK
jgi:CheY-like chemotaxis protein/GAF domain-containing protein